MLVAAPSGLVRFEIFSRTFLEVIDLASSIAFARRASLRCLIGSTPARHKVRAASAKHLMQVKTMKQMHSRLEPKLINLSAIKTAPAQDETENNSTG